MVDQSLLFSFFLIKFFVN
jgi:NAD(P)-dependent dehydrogenase (short-subunit alcohol dehydrogenase family)